MIQKFIQFNCSKNHFQKKFFFKCSQELFYSLDFFFYFILYPLLPLVVPFFTQSLFSNPITTPSVSLYKFHATVALTQSLTLITRPRGAQKGCEIIAPKKRKKIDRVWRKKLKTSVICLLSSQRSKWNYTFKRNQSESERVNIRHVCAFWLFIFPTPTRCVCLCVNFFFCCFNFYFLFSRVVPEQWKIFLSFLLVFRPCSRWCRWNLMSECGRRLIIIVY